MKARFFGRVAACVYGALILSGASFLGADDWLHFGYDDVMTSYARLEKTITAQNVRQLSLAWSAGDDFWSRTIYGSPVIARNRLFTTAMGQSLTAYDAITGDFLWQSDLAPNTTSPQPVATSDGTLIWLAGYSPCALYGIKAATGKKLWQAPITFEIEATARAVPAVDETRNIVYIVTGSHGDGKLYALNRKSGKVLWYKSKTLGGVPFKGDYVLLKGSWIFATAQVEVNHWDTDKLARINAASKKIELYYTPPAGGIGTQYDVESFAICNEKLVVVYVNKFGFSAEIKAILCVYNITSSQAVWQKVFTTSSVTGAVACNTVKNVIYVPTDPYLYAYNVKNGAQVWKYQGYDAICSPTVANGVVYFLSESNMYALNETNKKRLFRYALGHEADASTQVAVANGMVYFSGSGGTRALFALGLGGGPQSPLGPSR